MPVFSIYTEIQYFVKSVKNVQYFYVSVHQKKSKKSVRPSKKPEMKTTGN